MVAIDATKQVLADAYKGIANPVYVALHTAAPGTTGANEATGGSPAYARKPSALTSGTTGTVTGAQVAIDVGPGTYTHVSLHKTVSGTGAGDLIDTATITSTTVGGQTQIIVTPSYVQS